MVLVTPIDFKVEKCTQASLPCFFQVEKSHELVAVEKSNEGKNRAGAGIFPRIIATCRRYAGK